MIASSHVADFVAVVAVGAFGVLFFGLFALYNWLLDFFSCEARWMRSVARAQRRCERGAGVRRFRVRVHLGRR